MIKKTIIDQDTWIFVYSEIAAYILEYCSSDPTTEVDENGDERYTKEKQDEYCEISSEVESIMETFFEKGE